MSGQVWMVRDEHTAEKLYEYAVAHIDDQLDYRVDKAGQEFTGSMPMHRLWFMWMDETARFMRHSGVRMPHYIDSNGKAHGEREFKTEDAHDLFVSRWLGTDENGNRYSWKLRTTSERETVAPKSKRLYALEKHQEWATEKGLRLTNPEDSEFRKLQLEQER